MDGSGTNSVNGLQWGRSREIGDGGMIAPRFRSYNPLQWGGSREIGDGPTPPTSWTRTSCCNGADPERSVMGAKIANNLAAVSGCNGADPERSVMDPARCAG